MTKRMYANAALCALAVLCVQSQALAQAGGRMPGLVSKADKDQDGKTSYQELVAVMPNLTLEHFKRLDTDGDGVITRADHARGPGQKWAGPGPGSWNRKQAQDPAKAFGRIAEWDVDKDGKITFEEAGAAVSGFPQDRFDRLDRNRDGFVSEADFRVERPERPHVSEVEGPGRPKAAPPAVRTTLFSRIRLIERLLTRGDADGNGSVSFDEAKAYTTNITPGLFGQLDSDGDGVVSETDKNQFSDYLRGEHLRSGLRPKAGRPVNPTSPKGLPEKNVEQQRREMRDSLLRPGQMRRPRSGDLGPQFRRRGPRRPPGSVLPQRRGYDAQRPQRPQVPRRPVVAEPETGSGAEN